MASEHGVELDWRQAEVRGGRLTLPLTEKASKRWVREVESVLERLAPDTEVDVGRERLELAVTAGEEGDIRHLLESAVQEANARLAPDEDDGGDGQHDAEDSALTEAFRAFAPAED